MDPQRHPFEKQPKIEWKSIKQESDIKVEKMKVMETVELKKRNHRKKLGLS